MEFKRALEVVLELAEQTALDPETCDPEQISMAEEQQWAITTIHELKDFLQSH